jgi:hypothetical protein
VLPGPTIHAEDLAIRLHRHSNEIKGFCKNIDRATEESIAHFVLLHTGKSLEIGAIFLFQAHMFARKTNESAQRSRMCMIRPEHISRTLTLVETLAREDVGDSLTPSVFASIHEILSLVSIRCLLQQDPTIDFSSTTPGSRDPTPQCTTTPHITA